MMLYLINTLAIIGLLIGAFGYVLGLIDGDWATNNKFKNAACHLFGVGLISALYIVVSGLVS